MDLSPEAWGAIGLIGAAVASGVFGLTIAYISNRRTKRIEGELKPNGGHSLHDLVSHIAVQVNVIEQNVATLAGDIRGVNHTLLTHTEELATLTVQTQAVERQVSAQSGDAASWRAYLATRPSTT